AQRSTERRAKAVSRRLASTLTTEPEIKPSPLTVSVNAGPPTAALFGASDVSVGTATLAAVVRTLEGTEGTPLLFKMNSMYGPGGARFADGDTTFRPPATRVKLRRLNRWFWSKAWVTEGRLTRLTCVISAASGVSTKNVCWGVTLPGVARIVGRAPTNKY